MVLFRSEYGSVARLLEEHGYGPGGENLLAALRSQEDDHSRELGAVAARESSPRYDSSLMEKGSATQGNGVSGIIL